MIIFDTVPDMPQALSLTGITKTSFTLTWSNGRNEMVSITTISYYDYDNSSSNQVSFSAYSTHYTVDQLTPGHKYKACVVIQSYNKTSQANCIDVTTGDSGQALILFDVFDHLCV